MKANSMTQGGHSSLRVQWLATLLVVALAGVLAIVAPAPARADKSITWTVFDVTIDLQQDGSYHVTERQQIDFSGGTFTGGFATLPLDHTDGIDNIGMAEVDDTGKITTYAYKSSGSYNEDPNTFTYSTGVSSIAVDWGFSPAYFETRTFLLTYDVHGALRVYSDANGEYQQIWWTAISKDVTDIAPVESSTVTINLPTAVDPTTAKLGEDADENWQDHTKDGQTWTWTQSNLGEGDEFTVRLEFPAIVDAAIPSWQAQDDAQRLEAEKQGDRDALYNLIFLGIGLLTIALGAIGLYGLWYFRGRDPHVGLVADFLPQPPDNLPPGVVGALVDETADQRDIVATLVDLGQKGVITIEEEPGRSGRDYKITLKQASPTLAPYEMTLLKSLFGGTLQDGATEQMSRANSRFTNAAETIKAQIYDELVTRGYFSSSPEATRRRWRTRSRTTLFVLIFLIIIGSGLIARVSDVAFLPLVVICLILLALSRLSKVLPKKTEAGADAAAKWKAFYRYLSDIDRYDKVSESKAIFDKYLPYAVAFGLEHSWVDKFASVGVEPPAWYGPVVVGTGGSGWGGNRGYRSNTWGGGWSTPTGGSNSGGGSSPSSSGGGFNFPDVQDMSDSAGRGVQRSSDGFFGMLGAAARAFSDISASSGGSSSSGRRNWGGGGGGFHGGGSHGGGGGGGGRGFH